MLRAIERMDPYVIGGRDAFSADPVGQVWVVHHLEILGEAARSVSTEVRAAHVEVPWSKIVSMRNVLIHHYFEIDVDRLWGTIERDLAQLRSQLAAIAAEMGASTPPSSAP